MKWKRFISIPVWSVILLMGFLYYATVFVFIEDWVGLQTSSGSLNVLIFTLLASLCLFSFFVAVVTDPGYVPSSYVPDVEGSTSSLHDSRKDRCDKCSMYKPPRAHHCRVCRTCILRMDHHCMWINNCVGYWNYKAFFDLIFYATVAGIHSMVIIIICAMKEWEFNGGQPRKIFYVVTGMLTTGLVAALVTLFGWHVYLISRNMTTIEYHEAIRAAWLAKKSGQIYRHPFDLNDYRNLTLVLGSNMLKWFCPAAVSHLKDGLS